MHFRQGSNGFYVVIGQAVSGVNLQSQARGVGCRFGDSLQLFRLRCVVFGIGIAAGVNFDIRCAHVGRRFNLGEISVDK